MKLDILCKTEYVIMGVPERAVCTCCAYIT